MPAGSKEYFIPPVQPIASAPNSFAQPRPGQPQPAPVAAVAEPGTGDIDGLLVLVGGIAEALIGKGVLTEEDIHNAIATLQQGGVQPNPNGPEGKNKMASGSPGYPGGADTDKGMGAEHAKSKGE